MIKVLTWLKHGLHRPGRCCLRCHEQSVLDITGAWWGYVSPHLRAQPSIDRGPNRRRAALHQTARAAGDWF